MTDRGQIDKFYHDPAHERAIRFLAIGLILNSVAILSLILLMSLRP